MELEIGDQQSRNKYIEELKDEYEQKSFPVCEKNTIKKLVEAVFVAEMAENKGFTDFSNQVRSVLDNSVRPLNEYMEKTKEVR